VQILKEYWAIFAFGLSTLGGFLITWFRLGQLYQRFRQIEDNSGKISDGVKGKEMAEKHETSIAGIHSLCRMRGEQLARLEKSSELMLASLYNLSDAQSNTNKKIDALATSILNMAINHHERHD
jgi:hypothetical protein